MKSKLTIIFKFLIAITLVAQFSIVNASAVIQRKDSDGITNEYMTVINEDVMSDDLNAVVYADTFDEFAKAVGKYALTDLYYGTGNIVFYTDKFQTFNCSDLADFEQKLALKLQDLAAKEGQTGMSSLFSNFADNISMDNATFMKLLVNEVIYSVEKKDENTVLLSISPKFGETMNQLNALTEFANSWVEANISSSLSDELKLKRINDYINSQFLYDSRSVEQIRFPTNMVIGGRGLSQSYSTFGYILLKAAGFPSILVTGKIGSDTSKEPHAWNMVQAGGKWYHMDFNLNDPVPDSATLVKYTYFLKSDSFMTTGTVAGKHYWDKTIYPAAANDFLYQNTDVKNGSGPYPTDLIKIKLANSTTYDTTAPTINDLSKNVLKVSLRYYTGLALTGATSGSLQSLWAWGQNTYKQVNDSGTTTIATPVKVNLGSYAGQEIEMLESGRYASWVKFADKTLLAWGFNTVGQLGLGTTANTGVPTKVTFDRNGDNIADTTNLPNIVKISCAEYHTLLLDSDGIIWGSGSNVTMGLGKNSSDLALPNLSRFCPLSSPVGKKVIDIATGFSGAENTDLTGTGCYSLIILEDNTLWATGSNDQGQLGNGTQNRINGFQNIPAPTGKSYKIIDTEVATTIAVMTDGTVYGFGSGTNSNILNNDIEMKTTPVQLDGLTNINMVNTGNGTTILGATDGRKWVFGLNASGQLGIGNNTNTGYDAASPAYPVGDTTKIIPGALSIMRINSDGTIQMAGSRIFGAFGDNVTSGMTMKFAQCIPTVVGGDGITFFEGVTPQFSDTSGSVSPYLFYKQNGTLVQMRYQQGDLLDLDGQYTLYAYDKFMNYTFTHFSLDVAPSIKVLANGIRLLDGATIKSAVNISVFDISLVSRTIKCNSVVMSWPLDDTISAPGTYEITAIDSNNRKSTFTFIIKNLYEPLFSEGYLSGLAPGSKVINVKNVLQLQAGQSITFTDSSGVALSDNSSAGTGTKINITGAGDVNGEFTIIIYGDINGDNAINATDVLIAKRHTLSLSLITDQKFLKAGNVKKNVINTINATDVLILKRHTLNLAIIEQ